MIRSKVNNEGAGAVANGTRLIGGRHRTGRAFSPRGSRGSRCAVIAGAARQDQTQTEKAGQKTSPQLLQILHLFLPSLVGCYSPRQSRDTELQTLFTTAPPLSVRKKGVN
jgi:hypothetical protein